MKKAGQIILEHDQQRLDMEDDITEYRRSMEPEIMQMIIKTAENVKDQEFYYNEDFYIVLLQTVDPVLKQPKNIVLARKSCPTPVYKQSVWKYHTLTDHLEFMWSIPDVLLYYHIVHNASKYLQDKETKELAQFVILMESGELLEWVKKENGEKVDAVIKITPEIEENLCLN